MQTDSTQRAFGVLGNVMFYWTCSRVIWAVGYKLADKYNVDILSDSSLSAFGLIVLFICLELGPIFLSLDYGFINMVSFMLSQNESAGSNNVIDSLDIGVGFKGLSGADDDLLSESDRSMNTSEVFVGGEDLARFSVHTHAHGKMSGGASV